MLNLAPKNISWWTLDRYYWNCRPSKEFITSKNLRSSFLNRDWHCRCFYCLLGRKISVSKNSTWDCHSKLINPRWAPLLQTPPFPEYVSGHSVVSSAAALVLTQYFGDNQAFVDNTETLLDYLYENFNPFSRLLGKLLYLVYMEDSFSRWYWTRNLVRRAGR